MKFPTKILILIMGMYACTSVGAQTQNQLEEILGDLYQSFGNYQFEKPSIEISSKKEIGAGYYRAENKIVLEGDILEICRSLGQDSSAALYFILGHELTHFYQEALSKNRGNTNFLAYTEHAEATYRMEKDADLQGAFLSYLCGQDIKSALPDLIEDLYEAYDLEEQLAGYPPKGQRLHTAAQTVQLQERMVTLYDNSVALMILGEYDFAREGFQSLQEYYQGYEVRYNIGLCALLEAIYFPEKNIDRFFFPIEISDVSRIHKPDATEGEKDLNLNEMWRREILLSIARTSFIEVQRVNPTYIPAYLGFATVLILEKDFTGAKTILEKTMAVPGGKAYRYELMLLEAIIEAMKDEKEIANQVFLEVKKSGSMRLQRLADLNLQRLKNEKLFEPRAFNPRVNDKRAKTFESPMGLPILLVNGTNMYEEGDSMNQNFTYLGNKRRLTLRKQSIDSPVIQSKETAIPYEGSRYDFYFFPETHSYWKIQGNQIIETGTILKN